MSVVIPSQNDSLCLVDILLFLYVRKFWKKKKIIWNFLHNIIKN